MILSVFLVGRSLPGFGNLVSAISRKFRARVQYAMIDMPATRSFNKKREQFNAEKLLRDLFRFAPPPGDKAVYIIRDDMYAGKLSFVFGLAAERACILSTARLDPRFYGEKDMEKARELFKERVIKEAVHEIGHMVGLFHCPDRKCVMAFSNSVEDVDFKEKELCKNCRKSLPGDIIE
ncbi:archaemetzincin family Zn-dependent metalloprotease [Candidatus Micrarchaeota archaeon]|nr:archaemetzincin family Zn-dependent metalloprotease [Candidatus Micrarchaeota archaeon]